MKNDTRNRISDWYASTAVRGGVLLCFITQLGLTPILAFADVSLPPPAVHQTTNNGFPSSQALKNQGYDPSTGVLRVDERNRGTSTVTKTGDTITGQQQKTVTVTGNYGEKGTMSTAATQKTSVSKLNTAAGAVIVGSAIGNAASSSSDYANKTASLLAQGDYLGAAHNAILTAGAALDGVLGGAISGTINTAKSALDTYDKTKNDSGQMGEQLRQSAADFASKQAQAERKGDLGGAIAQAAAAKAAQGAAQAAKSQSSNSEKIDELPGQIVYQAFASIHEKSGSRTVYYSYYVSSNRDSMPSFPVFYTHKGEKGTLGYSGEYVKELYDLAPNSLSSGASVVMGFKKFTKEQAKKNPTATNISANNLTLNSDDIQKILERMLESQQTNHKELMEQLAKMGDTVEQATTSKEFTPSVAYSDPYTPAGSDTPQQTRFEIDKNGNITTSTVSRPDLKPKSSQAPTRTVVIPNKAETGQQTGQKETGENTTPTTGETGQQTPTTGQTGQQTPTTGQTGKTGQTNQQNQQQKEFCEKNPNSAACAELGEADYEDLSVPESNIDLKLQPMDIFSTDGTCPANPTFSIGALGTFEIPYQYLCDVARLIRPILILSTIIGCGFFAYSAVREL